MSQEKKKRSLCIVNLCKRKQSTEHPEHRCQRNSYNIDDMDMEDKLSIKNVIFTKSFPNYDVPAPIEGHKIFPCIDCGDKFMFESSYNDHFARKSMQITYLCRFCNKTQLYFNRCMLLYHIRSHTFKTATINVNDIKVEPLPLNFYKALPITQENINTIETGTDTAVSPHVSETNPTKKKMYACYECKQDIVPRSGINYKDRVSHYMQYTNQVHTCPVCLFALPTICGLRAHVRFHLDKPPFFCPECGIHLTAQKRKYPYGHDCDGFKMMRVTTRLKCPIPNTEHFFHPNDFLDHMKANHLKKVYKCAQCVVACFNEATMNTHSETHVEKAKSFIFFQCELCPGKLVVQSNIDNHLRTHTNAGSFPIYPCWTCGSTFNELCTLLDHHTQKHKSRHTDSIKNIHTMVVKRTLGDMKRIYRVVKRCGLCKRNFTYKCNFNEISVLPSECPFKCSKSQSNFKTVLAPEPLLTCLYCNDKISQNWEDIKTHYELKHKEHKCLDLKVSLEKIDITKYLKKKRQRNANQRKVKPKKRHQVTKASVQESYKQTLPEIKYPDNYCTICEITCESKEKLETHFLSHKDPCMAYQCMECGQSFIVKPSFATHLMLKHGISDAEEYISKNNHCYNEIALEINQSSDIMPLEPTKENQCKICREQFDNPEDLAKHFRGHGMAFLLKSSSKNVP